MRILAQTWYGGLDVVIRASKIPETECSEVGRIGLQERTQFEGATYP